MSRRSDDTIEFPANPFVALADVVIVLLLVMLLALLHQSISSSRLIERMAVNALQSRLFPAAEKRESQWLESSPILEQALKAKEFSQPNVDGDLQRFRFSGSLLFDFGQSRLKTGRAEKLLGAFGKVLTRNQGDIHNLGSGLFKRIAVQGNTDPTEGDQAHQWKLSLERAQAAVRVLEEQGRLSPSQKDEKPVELSPKLIEISGSGSGDPVKLLTPTMSPDERKNVAAENRRIDIIVYYSGHRAVQFLSSPPDNKPGGR